MVARFPCVSLGSQRTQHEQGKILGPYCAANAAAGGSSQTVNSAPRWQELFLLTSAVFIIAQGNRKEEMFRSSIQARPQEAGTCAFMYPS